MWLLLAGCYISDEEAFERFDLDGDGFLPPIAGGKDCDEGDPKVKPGADELCDGIDNDCNGQIDDSPVNAPMWFPDLDQDGHGAGEAIPACVLPDGHAEVDDDCDDTTSKAAPGRKERCDGIDNNCDGDVDEGFEERPWYVDADEDGFGDDATEVMSCFAPEGTVSVGGDCDDDDDARHPDVAEVWYDGFDVNCDGANDFDADGDGFVHESFGAAAGGTAPGVGDCDDLDAQTNPDATEQWYDGIDGNCDGANDYDQDADGVVREGDDGEIGGTALQSGDCRDTDDSVYPDAPEVFDGQDNDCDGFDETHDADSDGLVDGDEFIQGTDPDDPDSDDGGKLDGEEVLEGRDPLDPSDDMRTWVDVAVQYDEGVACAIDDIGVLECWGETVPQVPTGRFLEVSDGCALRESGEIVCWNGLAPPSGTFGTIASTHQYGCAGGLNQLLECWGDNTHGQSSPPGTTAQQISLARQHACVRTSAGTVHCWGSNTDGQTSGPCCAFDDVVASEHYSCGVRPDRSVECWGRVEVTVPPVADQLAASETTQLCSISASVVSCDSNSGLDPGGWTGIVDLSIGYDHYCGIDVDGGVRCEGEADGQQPPP